MLPNRQPELVAREAILKLLATPHEKVPAAIRWLMEMSLHDDDATKAGCYRLVTETENGAWMWLELLGSTGQRGAILLQIFKTQPVSVFVAAATAFPITEACPLQQELFAKCVKCSESMHAALVGLVRSNLRNFHTAAEGRS